MSLQQLGTSEPWSGIARAIINTAIKTLAALPASITAEIAAAITALKAAANTWTNTNNFTGTLQVAGVSVLSGLRGHIAGLTLANNAGDATNDIDIAVGAATADDQSALLVLAGALTKRLDAAWAVGTNQGGLDTGSIANTTYHMWLIRRPDTGVVDVLFSASASSPTMPTGYTQKRRVGSIIRAAGAIVTFRQVGDLFKRTPTLDRNSTSAVASGLLALSIPGGVVVQPITLVTLQVGASVACAVAMGDAGVGGADTEVANALTGAGDSNDQQRTVIPPVFSSNTSSQIYFSQTNTTGTPSASQLHTAGWIDTRGKDS